MQAGARATEMIDNLQNFAAQEKIAYQTSDREAFVQYAGSETFDYLVIFQPSAAGLVIQESRNPRYGSSLTPAANQDMGLPELILIFLPKMQEDYEMKCEGSTEWQGQPAAVVYFQQRQDKPSRTFSLLVNKAVYPVGLKGRAWIASDSGVVMHMETGLIKEVPPARLKRWYLSIDYAPVQFQTRPVKIWLPEIVDGYGDFADRRSIVYHTFSDFVLFSVDVDQKIGKPKSP